jgi:TolA-binding protein
MDLLTQLQNYVGFLSSYMATNIDTLNMQAPSIAPPTQQALSQAAIASSSSSSSSSSAPPGLTASGPGGVSLSPGSPSSLLAIPPAPQLEAAFQSSLEDRAFQLSKRVAELQTLIGSLPAQLSSEEEQLRELQELQRENEEEQRKLEEAEKEAELWQRRVSHVLQEAAAVQLSIDIDTQPAAPVAASKQFGHHKRRAGSGRLGRADAGNGVRRKEDGAEMKAANSGADRMVDVT